MRDDIYTNNDVTYDSYLEGELDTFLPVPPSGVAITSINSITGPTVTFAGGTSGFSFVPGGTTITLLSPITTKGDLYTRNATTGDRLPVGANTFVLTADSSATLGIKWAAPATSGTVTSIAAGTGITLTPDPIVATGSVALTVPVIAANGGTGFTSYAVGDLLYASASATLSKLADVAVGSYLRSGGVTTAPLWSTTTLPNSATTGDLLYASASNVYSNLADIATGNALISGGVTTAPSWGKIGLTTHVTGTLGAANGGTGVANNASSTITISGNFATTLTVTNTTSVTLPTTGTLATLAGAESLTNKKLGSLTTNGPIYTSGGDGTLNSEAALAVARGGTGTGTAGIGAFNNITGFTSTGSSGATSSNLVFSNGPTFTSTVTSGASINFSTADFGITFQGNNEGIVGSAAAHRMQHYISGGVKMTLDTALTITVPIVNTGITADSGHTDSTVCQDTTSHQFYSGTGTAGICLGTSSERFKNSLSDIKEGLAEVLQLRPRNFRYNKGIVDSGTKLQYGFTAEEVVKVMPNIVAFGPKGELNSVDYGTLWVIYAKAIKDLHDKFEAQIELLSTRLETLAG